MPYGAARGEAKDVVEHARVPLQERNCGEELFAAAVGHGREEGGWDQWGEEKIGRRKERGDDVLRYHHLGPAEAAVAEWGSEDVVLDGVCEAVEEKVDGKEGEPVN